MTLVRKGRLYLLHLDAAVKYAELVSPSEELDLFAGDTFHFGKSKYIRTDTNAFYDQITI